MHNLGIAVMAIATGAGCVAGITAYLISYEEYRRHFVEKQKTRRMAVQTALVAFIFFVAVGVVLTFVLPRVL